jgi:hypothetical protein
MSVSSCSSGAAEDVDMGETPPSSLGRRGTPSASHTSTTSKNGTRGEKQRPSRAHTKPELLKDFIELLADGASTAKALELAEEIMKCRKGAMYATDDRTTENLIKRTIKETLAEYRIAPQGQTKGATTYVAAAMRGMVSMGLTCSAHMLNTPKVILARHGKEIIIKVGEAGEDILRRTPADTVQALRNTTKRRDATSIHRLPSGDVVIIFTGSNQWWINNKSEWLEKVFGPATQISLQTYLVLAKGLLVREL